MRVINMKYHQYETMLAYKKQGFGLLETMIDDTDSDFINFNSYWSPLSEEDFAHAWLYPNSVNVIKS